MFQAEARITLASVHAALGDYRVALPMLRAQIERLERCGGAEPLLADARAELAPYETCSARPQEADAATLRDRA